MTMIVPGITRLPQQRPRLLGSYRYLQIKQLYCRLLYYKQNRLFILNRNLKKYINNRALYLCFNLPGTKSGKVRTSEQVHIKAEQTGSRIEESSGDSKNWGCRTYLFERFPEIRARN